MKSFYLLLLLLALNHPAISQNGPVKFNSIQLNALRTVSGAIANGETREAVNERWKAVLRDHPNIAVDSAIGFITADAKTQLQSKVDGARRRVHSDSLLTVQLKTEKNRLLEALPRFQKNTQGYTVARRKYDQKPGSFGEMVWRNEGYIRNLGEANQQLEWLEEQLGKIGDDAQLANIDLQSKMQQQQQILQMISSVSKLLHDTAMAVIRKIG